MWNMIGNEIIQSDILEFRLDKGVQALDIGAICIGFRDQVKYLCVTLRGLGGHFKHMEKSNWVQKFFDIL